MMLRNLGSSDELFVENVNRDINRFIKRHTNNCVLIFPPVSSFHRFLIHQTCESVCQEYDLCTFSVGQGHYRRTVVCFRSQVLDPSKLTANQAASTSTETRYQKPLENWRSPSVSTSAQSKFSYDRWNSGSRMGVGNNGNDSRDHKCFSISRQQPASSRNHYELSETADTATTKTFSMLRQSPLDTTRVAAASVSCHNSPIHANETENSQSTATTREDSNASSIATATVTTATTSATVITRLAGDQQSKVQTARRERRPDRAVYVPRARRSQTTPPTTTTSTTAITTATAIVTATVTATATTMTSTTTTSTATMPTNTTTICSSSSSNSNSSSVSGLNHPKSNSITMPANVSEAVSTATLTKVDEITSIKKKFKTGTSNNSTVVTSANTSSSSSSTSAANHGNNTTSCGKERRTDRHRKSIDKTKLSSQKEVNIRESNKQQDCDRPAAEEEPVASNDNPITETKRTRAAEIIVTTNEMNTTKTNKSLKQLPPLLASVQNGVNDSTKITLPVPKVSHMLIEEVASNGQASLHGGNPPKCDIDEQELQRASKEINRSNRRIMKQTFVSDVLEIPDKIEHLSDLRAKGAMSPPSTTFDSTTEDEEDDWESKYDESGDCLDPRILEELEFAVGKVKITTPKTDYSAFLTNQAILNDEEFPHVLEVSNFPVEFKNQDLLMVFSQYKESGFDIKWVDDTHALAVFSSSRIAAEVLTMGHPFVVLKPLAEATLESRLKAKKCAGSLQPYRQRPETCAALARRLVTGALGVRLETAAAERENEKRVLRKAKERKLLAAKQRDEAWES